MTPILPMMPTIKVTFLYFNADGQEEKRFQAWCTAVPRRGELVHPEGGSKRVIVHSVLHCIEQVGESGPAMIPVVSLRELTAEEERKYLIVQKNKK